MKNALLNSDQSKNIKKMLLCAVTATVMLTTMIFTGNVLAASNKSYVAEGTDSSVTEVSSSGWYGDHYFESYNKENGKYAIYDGVEYPGTQYANTKTYENTRASGCNTLPCKHMVYKVFRTQLDAAKDFTNTYGLYSIRNSHYEQDMAATIYKIGDNAYAYTYATIIKTRNIFQNSYFKAGTKCIADRDIINGDSVVKSSGKSGLTNTVIPTEMAEVSSMGYYQGVSVPIYVSTPSGYLKKAEPGLKNDPDYYLGFWYRTIATKFHKHATVSSGHKHYKWDASQLFKFKHWGRKRCGSCA